MTHAECYERIEDILGEMAVQLGLVQGIDVAEELGFCQTECQDALQLINTLRRRAHASTILALLGRREEGDS